MFDLTIFHFVVGECESECGWVSFGKTCQISCSSFVLPDGIGGEAFLGDRRNVFVSFNFSGSTQPGEPFEVYGLDLHNPLVWYNEDLDAAVLQLDTGRPLPPSLGSLLDNASRSKTLYLIGHDNNARDSKVLDLKCPVKKFSDLSAETLQRCPGLVQDSQHPLFTTRTLLTCSLAHGSSGSPGFDQNGSLVVMFTTGYPRDNVGKRLDTEVEQAVNVTAIRQQLQWDPPRDFPELAYELFPTDGEPMRLGCQS